MKSFLSQFTVLSSSEIERSRKRYKRRQTGLMSTGLIIVFLSVLASFIPELKPLLHYSPFFWTTIVLLFFFGFMSLVMFISLKEDTLKTVTAEQCRELEGYVRAYEEIRIAVERILQERSYVIYREFVILQKRAKEFEKKSGNCCAFRSLQDAVRTNSKKA